MIPAHILYHPIMEQRRRLIEAYDIGQGCAFRRESQPGIIGPVRELDACAEGYHTTKRVLEERKLFGDLLR